MPDERQGHDEQPGPANHLREVRNDASWIRGLAPAGAALLVVVGLLTLFAPSVGWFLLYPLLLICGLGALGYAVAYLLRHF